MTKPIDEFHEHEVRHLASVLADTWDRFICDSAYVQADPDMKIRADRIVGLMGDFYMRVGKPADDAAPAE
jgi:hypothetical protein